MIFFCILFLIFLVLRISFGVYVNDVSWFASWLAPLTYLCVGAGAIFVIFLVIKIIKAIKDKGE